jgi:2-polyprenyl-3-methyl-5-hydroxy-6-metoxy-1,4-benzoquinol methylase
MNKFFQENDTKSARQAQYEAQKIAFAPIIFQVARSMRDLGILELLYNNDKNGLTIEQMAKETNISNYGIKTLIETSLSADIVKQIENRYFITKTGYFLLKDEMTNVNMNYNHYVNYKGLYDLDKAIVNEKAEGLKEFSDCETIYPVLSSLPSKVKQSWFEFDHFYSDTALDEAIDILLKNKPKKVLDIGGNTGKFSIRLANKSDDIKVTIADLKEQIALATANIKDNNLEHKVDFYPTNILDDKLDIPSGYDVIWMSQFLDCFKEEDIIKILTRVKQAKDKDAKIYIMEPLWDKQAVEAGAFCIINTSPYFTAMANGYSKMFNSWDMLDYIKKAGLSVEDEIDHVGICQSIIVCK